MQAIENNCIGGRIKLAEVYYSIHEIVILLNVKQAIESNCTGAWINKAIAEVYYSIHDIVVLLNVIP